MKINSDVNVLGSLSDLNVIAVLLNENVKPGKSSSTFQSFTSMKILKSYKRFEKAIYSTLLKFRSPEIETLIRRVFEAESVSFDSLMMLFWNASANNELFDFLNRTVYFSVFYCGRTAVRKDEVESCFVELRRTEKDLKDWSDSTIATTASKYLTLLKKFSLVDGTVNKTITHHYMTDKLFMLFVYWILQTEKKPNILESRWLQYGFMEKEAFIRQIMQKRFMKLVNLSYTGEKMKIEPFVSYERIYDEITKS